MTPNERAASLLRRRGNWQAAEQLLRVAAGDRPEHADACGVRALIARSKAVALHAEALLAMGWPGGPSAPATGPTIWSRSQYRALTRREPPRSVRSLMIDGRLG